MRLLFVADVSISGCTGGAERALHAEAAGLAARGHSVRVLTRRLPRHRADQESIDGAREYRYSVNDAGPVPFLSSTLRNARALFGRLLDEEPADLIHAHQPFTGFALLRDARRAAIPAVYTCHSLAFEEYATRQPHANPLLAALHIMGRRGLERGALKRSDRILTLSEFMRQRVAGAHRIPAERIDVFPGGVDAQRFRPNPDKASVRKELGWPADRFVFLTVRNLVPRMGLELLIRAMAGVAPAVKEAMLVIGGEGMLRPSLDRLIRELGLQERVRLAGFIPEVDLPRCYQAADLFILPTLQLEGFGLVTLEALASGLPVLGTRAGATPEILTGLDPQWLFDEAAPAAMARRMIEQAQALVRQPPLAAALARRCRRYIEGNYTWTRHLDRLEALYEEIRQPSVDSTREP
ncbi:MAG: glycosyltransferase family 4 protein [Nitrospirota bacterium]